MLKLVLILAVLPAVIFAGRISFTPCNDGGPVPQWAEVEGCDMNGCDVVNGQYVHLSAKLDVTVPARDILTRITARWAIINTELDLPDHVADGCNAFSGGCPLVVGSEETIKTSFQVVVPVSNITPTIEFIKTNEAGERVMCVRTVLRVISA